MGDFTFLLCPVSEDATLYYLSVVEEHIAMVCPTVSTSETKQVLIAS